MPAAKKTKTKHAKRAAPKQGAARKRAAPMSSSALAEAAWMEADASARGGAGGSRRIGVRQTASQREDALVVSDAVAVARGPQEGADPHWRARCPRGLRPRRARPPPPLSPKSRIPCLSRRVAWRAATRCWSSLGSAPFAQRRGGKRGHERLDDLRGFRHRLFEGGGCAHRRMVALRPIIGAPADVEWARSARKCLFCSIARFSLTTIASLFGREAIERAAELNDKKRVVLRSFKTLLSVSDLDRVLNTNAAASIDPHRVFQMRDLIVLYLAYLVGGGRPRGAGRSASRWRHRALALCRAGLALLGDSAGSHESVLQLFGEAESFRLVAGRRLMQSNGVALSFVTDSSAESDGQRSAVRHGPDFRSHGRGVVPLGRSA